MTEGSIPMTNSRAYGDGSGYLQQHRAHRVATWSVVTANEDCSGGKFVSKTRGIIDGWFATVPRGELRAFLEFAKHAGPNAIYVSDCRNVVDVVNAQVPSRFTSSLELHADLWREAARLLRDRGAPYNIMKIKAHRTHTRAQAETNEEMGMDDWAGNVAADEHAKMLAKTLVELDGRGAARDEEENINGQVIYRIAKGAALAFNQWAQVDGNRKNNCKEVDEVPDEEKHVLRRSIDGGLECQICRRTARVKSTMRRLQNEVCGGAIESSIHGSHRLRSSQGITWCEACGAFTTRWPRALLRPCPRKPGTIAQANVLRRLVNGWAPTTAAYLREVAVLEGRPADAVNHQAEKEWRASARSGSTEQAGDEQCQRTKHPAGCYLRLRGGPLHRRPASAPPGARPAADGAGDDGHDDGRGDGGDEGIDYADIQLKTDSGHLSHTNVDREMGKGGGAKGINVVKSMGRRRIRGKQTPETLYSEKPPLCTPAEGASWAGRLTVPVDAVRALCHACQTEITRVKCRGCSRPVCITCAKLLKHCP